ncbi:MAG TPA: YDG domain-containing protein, partial [Acidimicrobiales bacterium]
GGLVGTAENGLAGAPAITGSFATGAVTGGNGAAEGGFIGLGSQVVISTSYATGAVLLNGNNPNQFDEVGGFAGNLQNSQVSQSFASGAVNVNVKGEFSDTGGFVGSSVNSQISDAYASGAVTAPNATLVGGFAGQQSGGTIERVLASGAVDPAGGVIVGGLVGEVNNAGQLSDSYWDEDATGQTTGFTLSGGGAANNVNGVGLVNTGVDPFATGTYDWFTNFGATWSTPSAGNYPQLFGVSHVLLTTAQDTTAVYADFPTYLVNELGFQPLEGPSLVTGLTGGAVGAALSSSGHYDVTLPGAPYDIVFAGASATSPNGSGSYRFIYQDGQLTVTPRTVDPSLLGIDKTYDATTDANLQSGNYGVNGAVGGDDISLSGPTGAGSGTYDTQNVGFNIGVTANGPVSISGADAQNYVLSNTSIVSQPVGEIDPAPLEISAIADSKVYDGGTSSTGQPFVVGGLQGTDSVTDLVQAFDSQNAGARTLNVTGLDINDGNGGNNYSVTLDTAAGTITPAPLEISAVSDSKVYDGGTSSTGQPFVV